MTRVLLILLIFLSTLLWARDETTRYLSLNAEGVSTLEITAGAGLLNISSQPGLDEIQVDAVIHWKGDKNPKAITLTLKRQGSKAVLVSKSNEGGFFGWLLGTSDIEVDLTVKIPARMNLYVTDGSGHLKIVGTQGDVQITDGSGSIELNNLSGNIRISDGSGSMIIQNVKGTCTITDGSGEIYISDHEGNLTITDGSGDIQLEDLNGVLRIIDGSGDIKVERLQGNMHVTDGSGDVLAFDITGDLNILSDGAGDVVTKNISGQVIKND